MRSAGQIRDKLHARRLADYLLTRGISVRLDPGADGYTVWVHDEDRLAEARAELTRFLAEPGDPRYSVAREAEGLRAQARQAAPPPRAIVLPAQDEEIGLMATPLTLALLALCVVVAVYTQFAGLTDPRLAGLTIADIDRVDVGRVSWNHLSELRSGEVWRIITPCFIHLGAVHLLGNSLWLFDLGRQVEARHGTLVLLLLVLVLGAGSNFAQYIVEGPQFGGMSGVVFGLFGYVWLMTRFAPRAGFALNPGAALFMAIWFLVCFTGLVGPIANVAHGVGLVLGACAGGIAVWLHARRHGR